MLLWVAIKPLWENYCVIAPPVVLHYIIRVSIFWPCRVSLPPNVLGEGWRQGATEGRPCREIRARSLFVWFNITLVYPWTDAKTFKFRAKEQAMATYGFSKGQAGCKSCTLTNAHAFTHIIHTHGNNEIKSLANAGESGWENLQESG